MYWTWRRVLGPQGKLMAWNVEKKRKTKITDEKSIRRKTER